MKEIIKSRTKQLALNIIFLCKKLPPTLEHGIIAKQVIRSATSVGANYRAACRAKSSKDFIAKLSIVEEEADETLYWLELVAELGEVDTTTLRNLYKEINEILSIIVASKRTTKKNLDTAN